ncbi:hypothetical protein PENTCL1PPCAC_18825 [Pristionchus entomophagus]|uniref:Uncharacterized protein n=1 Tax=Pristionchus entomophagus TaxID=358040 RepID=A0AAV5TQD8_9BILA|nr:hypothetical protein PENTCL1PPCAC_18825 [Pristionchus entomophagus]
MFTDSSVTLKKLAGASIGRSTTRTKIFGSTSKTPRGRGLHKPTILHDVNVLSISMSQVDCFALKDEINVSLLYFRIDNNCRS